MIKAWTRSTDIYGAAKSRERGRVMLISARRHKVFHFLRTVIVARGY